MSCDFTTDLSTGFDGDILFKYLKKEYIDAKRQAQFSMKADVKDEESYQKHYTMLVYDKWFYNVMVENQQDIIGF